MAGVTILGATGSIGVNTLDVISQHKDRFKIIALTAKSNTEALSRQCLEWNPLYAVMIDENAADQLQDILKSNGCDTKVLQGTALGRTDEVAGATRLPANELFEPHVKPPKTCSDRTDQCT